MNTRPHDPVFHAQALLEQRRRDLRIKAEVRAQQASVLAEEFTAATKAALKELQECGAFERNEAAARAAQERADAQARAEAIAGLRARGVALKHARVLVGELPLRDPEVVDGLHRFFALDMARRWGASDSLLLVLCGPKGCGKSLAGAEQVMLHGGVSVPARILLRHAWWANKTRKDGSPIPSNVTGLHQADLLRCSTLMIDDVGQEDAVDYEGTRDVVDHLVCLRCDAGLRTIITTNHRKARAEEYSKENLAGTWEGYLGPRLQTFAGRVCEYGAVLQCPAHDVRAEDRAERAAAIKLAADLPITLPEAEVILRAKDGDVDAARALVLRAMQEGVDALHLLRTEVA